MSERQRSPQKIAAEARAWFKKLSNTSVSNEDIWAYAAWCRGRGCQAAYNRVEARAKEAPSDGLFTQAEILAALKRCPELARAYRAAFKGRERPATLSDIARALANRVGPNGT